MRIKTIARDLVKMESTDELRGKIIISVILLSLEKEFSFCAERLHSLTPTMTVWKDGKIFAEKITVKVVTRNLEFSNMSPAVLVAALCMMTTEGCIRGEVIKCAMKVPEYDEADVSTILIEALQ